MTIYMALRAKLGREPTPAELKADVQRILAEVLIARATAGQLRPEDWPQVDWNTAAVYAKESA